MVTVTRLSDQTQFPTLGYHPNGSFRLEVSDIDIIIPLKRVLLMKSTVPI